MTGRLAYFEWSADPDADPDDPEAWADANPALGFRIPPEAIERDLGALDPDDFTREHLGIFPAEVDAIDPVIDEDDWRACAKPGSAAKDPVVLGFAVSLDRRWSCIAAVGDATTGVGIHVELLDNRQRTGWVVPRLLELQSRHSPAAIACNPTGPAGGLLAECEKAGLKITEVGSADWTKACQAALDAITEHQWRHLDQPALNTAVSGTAKRSTGDAWVFDRRAKIDISPLEAVALAAWVKRPTKKKFRALGF